MCVEWEGGGWGGALGVLLEDYSHCLEMMMTFSTILESGVKLFSL